MNATENASDNQAPDELEELLPWHAAGTLSRREAERVEQALKRDPALARRYELVREELAETIHLNETLGAPSALIDFAVMKMIRLLVVLSRLFERKRRPRTGTDPNTGTFVSPFTEFLVIRPPMAIV
mgnify:CR=1 FL=1